MPKAAPAESAPTQCRMDFSFRVLRAVEETRYVEVEIKPDPRRYTPVMRDGEQWYLDKFLNNLISLKEFAEKVKGLPIYCLHPSIESTPDYAARRKNAVEQELETGAHVVPPEGALAHRSLEADSRSRSVSFLSVDIVGSTALRRSNASAFERAHKILISELGTMVGQFNGSIVTLTGDGLIASVDHPSFTSLCDATVDLGSSLLTLLQESINPALKHAGLPTLSIRVGADYGEVAFRSVRIESTGYTDTEIASDALNRAVKIQESCQPNEFRIGRSLYELIHVQWLERAEEVPFDGTTVGIDGYKTYRLR